MNFEKSDFTKLRVNVVSMDSDRNCLKENEWLGKVFHQFADDDELNGLKGITLNLLVRGLVLCYDPNSPLVLRIQDTKQRKIEAFKLLNVKTYKDGRFSEDVDKVILGKNGKFNRMVLQFLKAIDNLAYTSVTYYLESYYDLLAQLQSQEGKDLAQILILIEKIEAQVKKKSKEFFMGDETLVNYVASDKIYEEAEALTPEAMAKKFSKMKQEITD
jgi:hypothetical protein